MFSMNNSSLTDKSVRVSGIAPDDTSITAVDVAT